MRLFLLSTLLLSILSAFPVLAADTTELQKILNANLNAQNQDHTLPPAPSAEETKVLLEPIIEYYSRLWTLSPDYPEVFTASQQEMQRITVQAYATRYMIEGSYDSFTNAYVDTSSLQHYIIEHDNDTATIKTSGILTLIIGGHEEAVKEDIIFNLLKENGEWKIASRQENGHTLN